MSFFETDVPGGLCTYTYREGEDIQPSANVGGYCKVRWGYPYCLWIIDGVPTIKAVYYQSDDGVTRIPVEK